MQHITEDTSKYQQIRQTSFSLCYLTSLQNCLSCFINPLLGYTIARFYLIKLRAQPTVNSCSLMRQAIIIVELLDTPALQCTSTLVFFKCFFINLCEESKKHLMFQLGLSPTKILNCQILVSILSSLSPKTLITAPILCQASRSPFCTKRTLLIARPILLPLLFGYMIQ